MSPVASSDTDKPITGVKNILESYDIRIRRLDQESLELKRKRNSVSPINKIPMEILLRIFLILTRVHEFCLIMEKWRSWDWIVLTEVCHHWRFIALNFPLLWAEIKPFFSIDRIRESIERSRESDLHISFIWSEKRQRHLHAFLDLLSKQIYRVRDLSITMNESHYEWDKFQDIICQDAPKMKSLILQTADAYHGRYFRRLNLSQDKISMNPLKIVSLKGIYLYWDCSILQGLSELHIESMMDYEDNHQLTLSELLDILESCMALQKLTLNFSGIQRSNYSRVRKRITRLTQLQFIKISPVEYSVCEQLFENIIVPKNAEWQINCKNYLFSNQRPVLPELLNTDDVHGTLSIAIDDSMISFESGTQGGDETRDGAPKYNKLTLGVGDWHNMGNRFGSVNAIIKIILGQKIWCNSPEIAFYFDDLNAPHLIQSLNAPFWYGLFNTFPESIEKLCFFLPDYTVHVHDPSMEEGLVGMIINPPDNRYPDIFRCAQLMDLEIENADFSTPRGCQAHQKLLEHMERRKCNLTTFYCKLTDEDDSSSHLH